jgi:hypothetical protein
MHNSRKVVCDTFSDIYTLIQPWIDIDFWDFETHEPIPGAIYIVGRKQCFDNPRKFREMASSGKYQMVFANSAEGSTTQIMQIQQLGLEELVIQGKILLLTGGALPENYPHFLHEHFFVRIFQYEENIQQAQRIDEIFQKTSKPFDFLFLNGRARPQRKYLFERFRLNGLIDRSIWTMMDPNGVGTATLSLKHRGQELLSTPSPVRYLDDQYEVERYRNRQSAVSVTGSRYVKHDVFDNEWGEIYLQAEPYIDTYFSLVTETILEDPWSFRTEKIAKPLAMGHPWICATNAGFYRDLKNMGFQTFDSIIDESFDRIENAQDRMDRIVAVVEDLCQQDLASFLAACQDRCKYNQQHIQEVIQRENRTFADRFFQFLDQYE